MGGSAFGPLAVIVDPSAGAGRVGREIDTLRRSLHALELEHRLWLAERPGDAQRLAADALANGHRFVVAVGADALVHDIVNGLVANGHPPGDESSDEPVLGLVPAGSGCDLARSFGLPEDTDGGCSHLAGENTYPFDLMKLTYVGADRRRRSCHAHNMVEMGLGAEVTARTASGRGRFSSFWGAYLRHRSTAVRIGIDAKPERELRAWNLVVGNGQFSAGLRLSPRSFPGDGTVEVLAFTGPRSDAYRMLPRIYRHGDHVPDPNIIELRARIRVGVDAPRPLPVAADGRPLGTTPATIQLVPRRILVKL